MSIALLLQSTIWKQFFLEVFLYLFLALLISVSGLSHHIFLPIFFNNYLCGLISQLCFLQAFMCWFLCVCVSKLFCWKSTFYEIVIFHIVCTLFVPVPNIKQRIFAQRNQMRNLNYHINIKLQNLINKEIMWIEKTNLLKKIK